MYEVNDEYFNGLIASSELAEEYKFVSRLNRGNYGEVIKLESIKNGTHSALKIAHHASNSQLFKHEFKILESLQPSSFVVRPIASGLLTDNVPYLLMQYVSGRSLNSMIGDGAIQVSKAVDIAAQLLKSVVHMESCGVVHRDLKPDNVMLSLGDSMGLDVVLVDFGSAFPDFPDDDGSEIHGTPAYTAPEYITNSDLSCVTSKIDVFSVGLMLYNMLSGAHPFKGASSQSMMYNIAHVKPISLADMTIRLPDCLVEYCHSLISKSPIKRPSPVDALLNLRSLVESGKLIQ